MFGEFVRVSVRLCNEQGDGLRIGASFGINSGIRLPAARDERRLLAYEIRKVLLYMTNEP